MEANHYRRRIPEPQREEAMVDVLVLNRKSKARGNCTAKGRRCAPPLLSELKPACPAGRLRPPETRGNGAAVFVGVLHFEIGGVRHPETAFYFFSVQAPFPSQ
jgi:hypothetical protein